MNERIRQLAEKAEFSAKDLHIQNDNFQRFAELIVQECADVCERFGESGDGYTCSAEILEHFGVK